MVQKTYQTTLLIRGDSKNAVRELQLSRSELEKLVGAQKKSGLTSNRMGQAFLRANTQVGRLSRGLQGLGGLLSAIGISAFVGKVLSSADAFASMRGQLKLVTDSQGELNRVYARSLALANETGQATEATVNLYARLVRSTAELSLSQDDLFTITQAVNQSFVVSGASATESSSAILQLSQGLAAGALRGEELNSVMENNPRLARALANGLGVSIGQLREMGTAGDLTAEAVTGALLKMSHEINAEFQNMPMTIGRAMQSLSNSVNDALGSVDTGPLTGAIGDAQQLLADPKFRASLNELASAVVRVATAFAQSLAKGVQFAKFLGEELSARLNGPVWGDIPRMEDKLERLNSELKTTLVLRSNQINMMQRETKTTRRLRAEIEQLTREINLAYKEKADAARITREQEKAQRLAADAARREAGAQRRLGENQAEANRVAKEAEQGRTKLVEIAVQAADGSLTLTEAEKRLGQALKDTAKETVKAEQWRTELAEIAAQAADGSLTLTEAEKRLGQALKDTAKETVKAQKELKTLVLQADPVAAALERFGKRLDDAFAGFFKRLIRDGKASFNGLKELALDALAEIIYAYSRRKIILALGLGAGSTGALAGTARSGDAGGLGVLIKGIANIPSAVYGNVWGLLNNLSGGFAPNALVRINSFFGNAAAGINKTGQILGGGFNTGSLITAGGGMLGGYLANQWFGPGKGTSVGSTLGSLSGGLASAASAGAGGIMAGLGAVAGPVGALVGAILGGALGSVFNKKPDKKTAFAQVDLRNNGEVSVSGWTGKQFSQENRDAVEKLGELGKALANVIGGSTTLLDIAKDNRKGFWFNEVNYGANVDQLVKDMFQQIINGARNLEPALKTLIQNFRGTGAETLNFVQAVVGLAKASKVNAAEVAREAWQGAKAVTAAARTATAAYVKQSDSLRDLVGKYDGSTSAAQTLGRALAANKDMAFKLATAILQASDQVNALSANSAKQIRQSVLGEEALRQARIQERDALIAGLDSMIDPARIRAAFAQIEQLNTQIFRSLTSEERLKQFESFATTIEAANRVAQERLREALADIEERETTTNAQITAILNDSAARQQEAAEAMQRAAAGFGAWVSRLPGSINVNVDLPRPAEVNR